MQLHENYGQELDNLQRAFDKVLRNMSGSSAADPLQIWIDLGMRNQFVDQNGNILQGKGSNRHIESLIKKGYSDEQIVEKLTESDQLLYADCDGCDEEFEYVWKDIKQYEGDDRSTVDYVRCPHCDYSQVVGLN